MNIKKSILIFLLATTLVFCACQITPDDAVVINKNDGELEKKIYAEPEISPEPILANTEDEIRWTEEVQTSLWDETYVIPGLNCEIYAQIITPQNFKYPVELVKKREFNLAEVNDVIENFVGDAVGVRETNPTKEDLEQELIMVKRGAYIEDDNGGSWVPYEGQEQDIARLEEAIISAPPEEYESSIIAETTMPVNNTYLMADNSKVYVSADNQSVKVTKEKNSIVQHESWITASGGYPGEPAGATINDIKVSEEIACQQAEALIESLGIEGFSIAYTDKARIINTYTTNIKSSGWAVTLTRNHGGYVAVDLTTVQLMGVFDFGVGDYSEKWNPESIGVYIDENGVQAFFWNNPLEVVEEVNSNVEMKDFETIKDMIKQNIKYGYVQYITQQGQTDIEQNIKINQIILTNLMIAVKDEPELRMCVPAWVVYYKIIEEDALLDLDYIFAINAIDGSSIDLALRMKAPGIE